MKNRAKQLDTKQELSEEHYNWWGEHNIYLTKDDVDHLLNCGFLFFDDGEYSHGLIYDKDGDMDEL